MKMNENPLNRPRGTPHSTAGVILAMICGMTVSAGAAETRVTLAGHIPAQLATAAFLQRASADEPVQMSLVVRLDQTLLDQTFDQLYGPGSPARRPV